MFVLSLRIIRKIFKTFSGRKIITKNLNFDLEDQKASDYIKESLLKGTPLMIARLGSIELRAIVRYYWKIYDPHKISNYIKGNIQEFWWDKEENIKPLAINAGFFPSTKKNIDQFCGLMLDDIKHIDILGSWLPNELVISDFLTQSVKIPLKDLEPYYHKNPWSEVLKGKKVLVIHPFTKSIERQYKKHDKLFSDSRVLPQFELKTIKAIQSIAGQKPENIETWFEALELMKNKISETDFDIAIIGCGAYGLPLAAHVKRIGKQAIHLGGQTQIMFGIKGKRWEDREFFLNMFNEHWIRPLPEETPTHSNKVEDGCYW
jgi:hypothetical protein